MSNGQCLKSADTVIQIVGKALLKNFKSFLGLASKVVFSMLMLKMKCGDRSTKPQNLQEKFILQSGPKFILTRYIFCLSSNMVSFFKGAECNFSFLSLRSLHSVSQISWFISLWKFARCNTVEKNASNLSLIFTYLSHTKSMIHSKMSSCAMISPLHADGL